MRVLIWAVAAVAVLWSGLWAVAARMTSGTLNDWIAAQDGTLSAQVSVSGFPNRVDVTATDITAGDPGFGPGWQAPFVQVFAMLWKPWHLIAALPPDQQLTLPGGQRIALGSDRLQASLVLEPGTALALDRLNIAGDGLRLAPEGAGEPGRIGTLRLAAHRDPENATILHIGAEAAEALPSPALRAAFPPGRPAPEGAAHLRLDARVELTRPVDRTMAETPPLPLALDVTELAVDWGTLVLRAKGTVSVDDEGYLSGRINLDVTGWQAGLDAAVAAGVLVPGVAQTWAAFATQLQDPSTGRITLPLEWRDGTARFGPLPIGLAPRIYR